MEKKVKPVPAAAPEQPKPIVFEFQRDDAAAFINALGQLPAAAGFAFVWDSMRRSYEDQVAPKAGK